MEYPPDGGTAVQAEPLKWEAERERSGNEPPALTIDFTASAPNEEETDSNDVHANHEQVM
jgi:hypothetical protein